MSRRSLAGVLLVATALGLAACGRYGPPRRPDSTTSADPGGLGPQGTSILNPTSEPLPAPEAPPEEPQEESSP